MHLDFYYYTFTLMFNVGKNCENKVNLRLKHNITNVLPPCSVLSHSFRWNQTKSCYAGSPNWKKNSIEDKLTSCCKMFRSIFSYGNIADLFKIMKFSLGQEIPVPISKLTSLRDTAYLALLPNSGNFSTMQELG